MKAATVFKFRSYLTAKEEWGHATRRCRNDSFSKGSSIKGRGISLFMIPGHMAGVVVKPVHYAAETVKHVLESVACMTWKANYFGDQAKKQTKIELKDALNCSVNVVVAPVGQALKAVTAVLGVFHPGAYFEQKKETPAKNQKVIIIGAGPVGLLTAIQTKILKPELEIKLIERNVEYERDNCLNLERRSFAKIPSSDEGFNDIVKGFFRNKKKVSIQTSEIEKTLKEKAIKLGVKFERRTVGPGDIQGLEANVVVCADGAHSKSREHLLSSKVEAPLSKAELPLQHIVQMAYEVEGKRERLSNYRKYPAMKAVGYLVEESLKYDEETNKTTVSVRFFVNQADYNQLISDKEHRPNFKNPLKNIESPLLTDQLKGALHLWLNYRQERGEIQPAESIKITPIGLSIYQSPKFSFDLDNGKKATLVGDAASGVPFFRSLNKGIKESSLLAKAIAKSVEYPERESHYFNRYETEMRRIARQETRTAISKNVGLKAIDSFAKISSVVPWQINKINKAKAKELKSKKPSVKGGLLPWAP